jgi:quinol monooxygenase YgiN
MPTLLVHMKIKTEHVVRFEEILRDLVVETARHEKDCLRYEYWRGSEVGQYYCLLSFPHSTAFYEHQASPYHEKYAPEWGPMFESFRIEYVDPLSGGGSGLPRASAEPLPAGAPDALLEAQKKYPIDLQPWWTGRVPPHVKD